MNLPSTDRPQVAEERITHYECTSRYPLDIQRELDLFSTGSRAPPRRLSRPPRGPWARFDPYFIIRAAARRQAHPFADSSPSRLPTRGENSFYWNRRQSPGDPCFYVSPDSLMIGGPPPAVSLSTIRESLTAARNTEIRSPGTGNRCEETHEYEYLSILTLYPRGSLSDSASIRNGDPHDRWRHDSAPSSSPPIFLVTETSPEYIRSTSSAEPVRSRTLRSPRQVPANFGQSRDSHVYLARRRSKS
jgi:hypothetical protein